MKRSGGRNLRTRPGRPLVLGLLLGVTCCTQTVLVADDYDQACATNSDCVIQSLGDQCAECDVVLTALHRDETEQLNADREAAVAACPPWSERNFVECVITVPTVRPVCVDEVCAIPGEGDACTFEDGLCRGVDD